MYYAQFDIEPSKIHLLGYHTWLFCLILPSRSVISALIALRSEGYSVGMTQSARSWHIYPFDVRSRARVRRFLVALLFAIFVHGLLAIGLCLVFFPPLVNEARPLVINATLQHEQAQQHATDASVNSSPLETVVAVPHSPAPITSQPPLIPSEQQHEPRFDEVLLDEPSVAQPISDWQADDALSRHPLERHYQQQVLAHLRQHLIVPAHLHGEVRIRFTIRYRHIATDLQVLEQRGDPDLALWITRRVLQANPFPALPPEFADPWSFSPTLIVQPR